MVRATKSTDGAGTGAQAAGSLPSSNQVAALSESTTSPRPNQYLTKPLNITNHRAFPALRPVFRSFSEGGCAFLRKTDSTPFPLTTYIQ